ESSADHRPQRDVLPPEVGAEVDAAVAAAHHTHHRHSHPDQNLVGCQLSEERAGHAHDFFDRLVDRLAAAAPGLTHLAVDVAPEADGGDRHRVDGELDGEDGR